MKQIKKILFIAILVSISFQTYSQLPTPDNYIIFFDLSARIEAKNQREKDLQLVNYMIDDFKKGVEKLYKGGKIFSTDKITVLFYPDLNAPNIINLTSSLSVDFSQISLFNRVDYYKTQFPQGITPQIVTNINKVYDIALDQNPYYFGSNIYEFFSLSINACFNAIKV